MIPQPNTTITELVAGLLDNMTTTDEDIMSLRALLRSRLTALDKMYIENERQQEAQEEAIMLQDHEDALANEAFEEMVDAQREQYAQEYWDRSIPKTALADYVAAEHSIACAEEKPRRRKFFNDLQYLIEYDVDTDDVTYQQLINMPDVFNRAHCNLFARVFAPSSMVGALCCSESNY